MGLDHVPLKQTMYMPVWIYHMKRTVTSSIMKNNDVFLLDILWCLHMKCWSVNYKINKLVLFKKATCNRSYLKLKRCYSSLYISFNRYSKPNMEYFRFFLNSITTTILISLRRSAQVTEDFLLLVWRRWFE